MSGNAAAIATAPEFLLADDLDTAANAVKDRLFKAWNDLGPEDRKTLEDEFWDIQSAALRLRTSGVGRLVTNAQSSVDKLSAATKRATDAIATLNDVRKAIMVATAVFSFAAALTATIAAPNPATIVAALKALKTAIDVATA